MYAHTDGQHTATFLVLYYLLQILFVSFSKELFTHTQPTTTLAMCQRVKYTDKCVYKYQLSSEVPWQLTSHQCLDHKAAGSHVSLHLTDLLMSESLDLAAVQHVSVHKHCQKYHSDYTVVLHM